MTKMNKIHQINSKAQVNFEFEWISEVKKGKPWYSKTITSAIALFILALIDLVGFLQGIFKYNIIDFEKLKTQPIEDEAATFLGLSVMVAGFLVAFEVSTIYMAYAFSLKLYNYDRQAIKLRNDNTMISKIITTSTLGWISFVAFLLGIILNAIFRIGILEENAYFFKSNSYLISEEWALTIVMIALPIITSIMNFVISCFTFDPILFELNHLAKQISIITTKIDSIEKEEKNIDAKIENIKQDKINAMANCNNAIISATSLRTALRTKFYEEEMRKVK